MIICICRRINDQTVRQAVRDGARSPESVQRTQGCTFNCGKCRPAIADVIHDELGIGCADACPVCSEPVMVPEIKAAPAL